MRERAIAGARSIQHHRSTHGARHFGAYGGGALLRARVPVVLKQSRAGARSLARSFYSV